MVVCRRRFVAIGDLHFITDPARGIPLDWGLVFLCSAIKPGIAMAALVVAMRFYNKERILPGMTPA
ncbi:MAG: hypothetical protein DCC51_05320 [Anaerolineae bacterium]|nr:MAG: hypothetical protein DCC51_05320 [Anaerolineae bacterium]